MNIFTKSHSSLLLKLFLLGFLSIGFAQAQPSFSQQFQVDTIGPGSHSYLVFTIDNGSGVPVTNAAFTNNLPAGVTLGEFQQNSCDGTLTATAGGSNLSFTDGEINAGQSCSITVSVTASAPGNYTNTSGDLTSSAGNSGTSTDDLTVATGRPGFSKSFSPSTVDLGEPTTLTLTIDNTANTNPAASLVFSDQLPIGLNFNEPANVTNTCGGTVAVDPGNRTISSPFDGLVATGVSCTISVDVLAISIGNQLNSSGDLSSVFSGPSAISGHAEASIIVNGGDLILQKQFIDDPVAPGGIVQLRYQLNNFDRFDAVSNLAFSDDMNAVVSGLVAINTPLSNVCGSGSAVTFSGGALALSGGTLPAEGVCDFTVSLQVPAGTSPGIYSSNSGSVSYTRNGSAMTGNQAAAQLSVSPAPVLTKEFLQSGTLTPGPVVAGDDVVLRFSLTNTSQTGALTDGTFMDELTTFLPAPINANLPPTPNPPCGTGSNLSLIPMGTGGQGLLLTGGNLPAGGSCSFDVTVSLPLGLSSGTYDNITEPVQATVDGETRIGNTAMDQLEVVAAPQLSKEFIDDPVQGGDTVTLEFQISHGLEEPGSATNISFSDDLDATLSGLVAVGLPVNDVCGTGSQIAGTSVLNLTGGELMPGETCSFQVTLQVPAATASGTYSNTTSNLSATVNGLAVENLAATDDLLVSPVDFQLNITPATYSEGVGGTMALEFTIDNLSGGTLSGMFFTANLNAALSGLSATGLPQNDVCGTGSSVSGTTTVLLSGGNLAAGESCVFTINATVPVGAALGGYSVITSDLSDGGVIADPVSDDFSVQPAMLFSKSFLSPSVAPGGTLDLSFTIENSSAVNALTGITFTDDLDAALSGLVAIGLPASDVCGTGSSLTGTSVITLTGGNLTAGASCTFTLTLQVPSAAPAGTVVTNTTSAISGTMSGQPVSSIPATDNFSVFGLNLSKSFDGLTGGGNTVDLTFSITNLDASLGQSDINFIDDLDAMLTGAVATGLPMSNVCGAGSVVSGTGTIQLSGGNLAAGASCQFTVTVSIPIGAVPGNYLNTTSSLFVRSDVAGTAASDTLGIEPPPTFNKAFSVNNVFIGDVVGLTFTIDNSASALTASNLSFVDNLPAGLTVATSANVGTTCTGGTLTASAGSGSISYIGGAVSAGSQCTVTVDTVANTIGSLVNVTGDLSSSLGNSGTASATLQVLAQLAIDKSFDVSNALPGDTVMMQFSVTNNNASATASAISFSDDLNAFMPGATAINVPQNDVCGIGSSLTGSTVLMLNNGLLAPGESCQINVNVQLPNNQFGQFTNTTSVINYTLNGTPVTGDASTAGEAQLAVDSMAPISVPVFDRINLWWLILSVVLLGLFYPTKSRKN